MRAAAIVLAAGSSRRLGQPKQLLRYRGTTILDITLDRVRSFSVEQRIVTIGGAAPEVRAAVDLAGFDVVDSIHYTTGCSSSIVAALDVVHPEVDGFLLFLGDQPEVAVEAVDAIMSLAAPTNMALCRYIDGLGHPFWFGRDLFVDLADLHGDKAVWRLVESGRWPVVEADVSTPIPLDVDTWDDYEHLLAWNNR